MIAGRDRSLIFQPLDEADAISFDPNRVHIARFLDRFADFELNEVPSETGNRKVAADTPRE